MDKRGTGSRARCLLPLLAALVVAGVSIPAAAGKQGAAFTIANYPVDATDKNAVAAKERALADGQNAAFRSLLKRLVPVTAYKHLARASGMKAANLVSGVSVRSEQNSSTQYIANLDFSFQADAVRSELQSRGIPFVEEQAAQITLLPVIMIGGEPKPDTSHWQAAWKGLDLEHTLTPIKLDEMRSVVHPDTIRMLLAGDDSGQRILAGEYKSETIVIAIAEADTAQKKLNITLTGRDAAGPINLTRAYRMSDGDLAYASEFAAVISLGVLEGRWKAMKTPALGDTGVPAPAAYAAPQWGSQSAASTAGYGDQVRFIAEFASPGQWNEMRTQILDTPGVENIDIANISAMNADVSLSYPGGTTALANALGARGLSLVSTGGGWALRSIR